MNTINYEDYLRLKEQHSDKHARDLAAILNISEAELMHCRIGKGGAQCLTGNIPDLLQAVTHIGDVKAITRNDYVVSIQTGQYSHPRFSSHSGAFLNPRGLDLRMFFAQWDSMFFLKEEVYSETRQSLQFFDKYGDALHKIYITEKTDMDAWYTVIEQFTVNENPPLNIVEKKWPPKRAVDEQLAQQLQHQWVSMTDVHQFSTLLKDNNLSRQQVFHAVSDELAWRVSTDSLSQLLYLAHQKQNEIMLFISNHGCVQIFTGKIDKIAPLKLESLETQWLNVSSQHFNLHIIENGITECWVTKKPTRDGFVTSLEVFDKNGNQIIQMYGQRTEGEPEQALWHDQILSLSAI